MHTENNSSTPPKPTFRETRGWASTPRLAGSGCDIADFKARAVVDWLTIELHTASPTNFQSIRAALSDACPSPQSIWVTALDPGLGGAASRFQVTLQEVADDAALERAVATLELRYSLLKRPLVVGIEVAIDWTHKNHDVAATYALVEHLASRLIANGRPPRQYLPSGRMEFLSRRLARIDQTATIYFGNSNELVQWRAYHKQTDQNRALPPESHRARVEVTLYGEAIAEHLFYSNDGDRLSFSKLGNLFRFHGEKMFPSDGVLADRTRVLRRICPDSRESRGFASYVTVARSRGVRGHVFPKLTIADAHTTKRARDSLRHLEQRFHKLERK
jgi:hypothetical protein